MVERVVRFEGKLLDRESVALDRLLERLGFKLTTTDDEVTVATRPDVIEKPDFVNALETSGADTRYYAGFAWSTLRYCYMFHRLGDKVYEQFRDTPVRFTSGGWSGGSGDNLLQIATLAPTIEWAQDGLVQLRPWGINERRIAAWQAVAQAYLPEVDTEPEKVL